MEHVTVTHRSGSTIELSLQFLHQPPEPPSTRIRSRITGQMVDGPGSTSYGLVLHNNGTAVSINSPANGKQWEGGSFANDQTVPVSATTQGSVVSITADLESQQELLGSGPFKPDISVVFTSIGNANPYAAAGFAVIAYQGQDCNWDTPKHGATNKVPPVAAPAPSVRSDPEADGGWADAHPPAGSFRRFQSATGNIACEVGGAPGDATVVCEVREHTYRPEVKSGCNPGWVNSFALRQGRAPAANCYAESVFHGSVPVQAYGQPVAAGSITCLIDRDKGVTCKDSSTGHYFQAARQEYRWR